MNLKVVKHYQKMEKIDKKMAKNTKKRFIQKNEIVSTRFMNLPQGPLMFINSFTSRFWMWGAAMCKLYGFLGAVFGMHLLFMVLHAELHIITKNK